MVIEKEYALYRGDEFIAIGTRGELAELLGVQKKTITYYGTPTYEKRTSEDSAYRLVKLDPVIVSEKYREYIVIDEHRRKVYKFPNGYGASVINDWYSYELELGVVKFLDDMTYEWTSDTDIADDVIGFIQDEEDLEKLLDRIFEL